MKLQDTIKFRDLSDDDKNLLNYQVFETAKDVITKQIHSSKGIHINTIKFAVHMSENLNARLDRSLLDNSCIYVKGSTAFRMFLDDSTIGFSPEFVDEVIGPMSDVDCNVRINSDFDEGEYNRAFIEIFDNVHKFFVKTTPVFVKSMRPSLDSAVPNIERILQKRLHINDVPFFTQIKFVRMYAKVKHSWRNAIPSPPNEVFYLLRNGVSMNFIGTTEQGEECQFSSFGELIDVGTSTYNMANTHPPICHKLDRWKNTPLKYYPLETIISDLIETINTNTNVNKLPARKRRLQLFEQIYCSRNASGCTKFVKTLCDTDSTDSIELLKVIVLSNASVFDSLANPNRAIEKLFEFALVGFPVENTPEPRNLPPKLLPNVLRSSRPYKRQ